MILLFIKYSVTCATVRSAALFLRPLFSIKLKVLFICRALRSNKAIKKGDRLYILNNKGTHCIGPHSLKE